MSVILRAPNTTRFIKGKPRTYLTSEFTSGGSTLTVDSIDGFAVSDMILIGHLGSERSVVVKVHAVTAPSGTTITLAAALSRSFPTGTPIVVFGYDQVEFSHAATESGAKSVLTTVSINAEDRETVYEDATNSTGYGFYRFKNSASTTYTEYSDAIPYAGYEDDAAINIFNQALARVSTEEGERMTYDLLMQFLNDFLYIARSRSYRYADAKVIDEELKTLETGDFEIDLPTTIARKKDPSAIIDIRINDYPNLKYVDIKEFNLMIREMRYTTLAENITSANTDFDLTNAASFASSGSLLIDSEVIEYTGKTNNNLTGTTVVSNHSSGAYAFQTYLDSVPQFFTLSSSGKIRIWPLAGAEVNNLVMFISYFRSLPGVTSLGDRILLRDVNTVIDYIAMRIKKHESGGSLALSDEESQLFFSSIDKMVDRDNSGQFKRVRVS